MSFPCGSAGKESTCSAGDLGSIPGLGWSPGEGKGYPFQYSGLENSMDCIVYGVPKSRTWLSNSHFHLHHKYILVVLFSRSVVSDLCDPMACSTPGFPVFFYLPELAQTHGPLSRWCHPTISSSVGPFSCLQSFPASGSFPVSQLFTSGGQCNGASASASVLPVNIQDCFPLGLTGSISLQSKGLSITLINSYLHEWFWLLLTLMIF